MQPDRHLPQVDDRRREKLNIFRVQRIHECAVPSRKFNPLRARKFQSIVSLVVAAAIFAGCGGGTTTVTTGVSQTTSTSTTTSADINQRIADRFAAIHNGQNLASICSQIAVIGKARTVQLGEKQLGPTILNAGGDVSTVVQDMLKRC
jgi:hypothetical protein